MNGFEIKKEELLEKLKNAFVQFVSADHERLDELERIELGGIYEVIRIPWDNYSTYLTNGMVEAMGLDAVSIWNTAIMNTRANPLVKTKMSSFVPVPETEDAVDPYVISNKRNAFGAVLFLFPEMMRELEEELGRYVILPSSVHELLVLPFPKQDARQEEEALINYSTMVRDINRSVVDIEDVLSDDPYVFDKGHLFRVINGTELVPVVKTA